MHKRTTIFATLVAGMFASPLVIAQEQPPEQEPPQQQAEPQEPDAPEVSDSQIIDFVEAHAEVVEIQDEYAERQREATDAQEAQELQQEADAAVEEAVEDTGMSMEEYEEVTMAMNMDPEVRDEVMQRLEEEGVDAGATPR